MDQVSARPITRVDDTFAHPCGCVAEGKPSNVVEACGKRTCPHFPCNGGADRAVLLTALRVKVRGK